MVEIRIPDDRSLPDSDINKRRLLFAILANAAKSAGVEDAREPWKLEIRIAWGDQKCGTKELPMILINDMVNAIDFHMGDGAGYWECDGQTLVIGSTGYTAW